MAVIIIIMMTAMRTGQDTMVLMMRRMLTIMTMMRVIRMTMRRRMLAMTGRKTLVS